MWLAPGAQDHASFQVSLATAQESLAEPPQRPTIATPESVVPASAVMPAIQRMIAPRFKGAPLKIQSISGPVQGWLAVAVSPPYREFPTVVLFRAKKDGSWDRMFEGLVPGVQPQRSGLLDIHTKGEAIDYTVTDGSPVTPDTIAKALPLSRKNRLSTVAHTYFFHSHAAGAEGYFVDRTMTYQFARRLFPGKYEKFPRTECTMFDVPALRHIELRSTGKRLLLVAQTENNQTWMMAWDGADDQGLLTGKTVDAK
jgi:hypothetical protein